MSSTKSRPTLAELPLNPNDPPYSAWGLWGVDDEVGTLNLLDESTVTKAASEIQVGQRFSLNWSLASPRTPMFGRDTCEFSHKVYQHSPELIALDDEKSSQVDGLRHAAYQKSGLFYNGRSKEDILKAGSLTLGIHHWHGNGLFAGRGILIDYWAYVKRHGKAYDATGGASITYDELMACLAEQSQLSKQTIDFRKGDMLLIRSGFTHNYVKLSEDQERKSAHTTPAKTCGVAQDERMLQFLWEKQMAMVGGDSPAWECLPPVPSANFLYHEVLLAGWGCPIGELLWLEDLARACDEHKKWTFFLTSAPLNVPGGVASPANMIAIL
ncbi:hypothetical protein AFGD_004759 [Aspergillus flavus]|uniref:Cyclase-domain-containing protein n=1 Tax=Aspergillus flavus TaxID=5059 RepID=A0AB74BRF1_ASPFL|nr:hypothetical protein AFGD_004759 [Aspergillus flavus]RMZ37100.1 hypothetical protein CA14_006377 [Aspergillus flavus]